MEDELLKTNQYSKMAIREGISTQQFSTYFNKDL